MSAVKWQSRAAEYQLLWSPADRKHWHGATPHDAMMHIAVQESVNGSPVT